MNLRDHVFLITGGGSGLGAATARQFAAGGGRIVIADIDGARGRELAEELGEAALFRRTDVTDDEEMRATIDEAVSRFGGLHGLVGCAGVLGAARVVGRKGAHELALFQRVIAVNLVGTFNATRLAAEAMCRNEPNAEGERGVIINTSSVAAYEGQIGQAAYSASKGGVASMTLPIARELAAQGVRVAAIAPGVFETPMMEAATPELRDSLAAQIPFPPRLGKPAEFAALARHIVENPMINGCVIRLDGAMRMESR